LVLLSVCDGDGHNGPEEGYERHGFHCKQNNIILISYNKYTKWLTNFFVEMYNNYL
jgi:hypothetical protein